MSKYLATDEFTIVGVGTTSMYMDSDRGSAAIGTGRINGFLIVPKQAFYDVLLYKRSYNR